MALQALRVNKLRTFLSILGITIGIFSIITVLAIVDSMERYLKQNINSLGNDVIFIQKWPWYEENYQWWKYMSRPIPTENDYKSVFKNSHLANSVSMMINLDGKSLKFGGSALSNVGLLGVTHQWDQVRSFEITNGRYFSELESSTGAPVVIIGSDIAQSLFANTDPVGREINMGGRKLMVIGVFKREGQSLLNNSLDALVVMPYLYAVSISRKNSESNNPTIMVKARENVPLQFMEDELKGVLRSSRRLKPSMEDNFALNKTTLLSDGINQLFDIIGIAGWIIGSFSIMVGGFGIANIMFVSVKERTNEIGIQKSLGAKNYFILLEFLTESVTLCLIGGIVGLIAVFFTTMGVGKAIDFELGLSVNNILNGIVISILIGIISGFVPALSASRLNPVDAIRSK